MQVLFALIIWIVVVGHAKSDHVPKSVTCDFPTPQLPPSGEPQRRRSLPDSFDRCKEMAKRLIGTISYDSNNVPKLSSRPGSTNVAYLDFDGHVANKTRWTNLENRFTALPYYNHTLPFTNETSNYILMYWCTMAEDFMPFDIDITTIEPEIFNSTTARVLFTLNLNTDTNSPIHNPPAGGVAYVNVWGREDFHTINSPAFVFHSAEKNIADNSLWKRPENLDLLLALIGGAGSHELGHNLGLSHHGRGNKTYADAKNGWSPIMGGASYTSTWSNGQYDGATNTGQDDIDIIHKKLYAFRPDEPNVTMMATDTAYGIINSKNNTISETDFYVYNISADSGIVEIEVKSVYKDSYVSNGKFGLSVTFANKTVTRNNECEQDNNNAKIKIDTQDNAGTLEITVRASFNTNKVTSAYEMSGSYVLTVGLNATSASELVCPADVTVDSFCYFDSCKNGGHCPEQSQTQDYNCVCEGGFTGARCETNTPTTSTSTSTPTTSTPTTSTPTTSTPTTSTPTTSTPTTSTPTTSTPTTSTPTTSTTSTPTPTKKILFVGNSLTYASNLPGVLKTVGNAPNSVMKFTTGQVTSDGAFFYQHAKVIGGTGAMNAIRYGKYDFVVLQEQSSNWFQFEDPFIDKYGTKIDGVNKTWPRILCETVRATGAKPIFFSTWANKLAPMNAENQATVTNAYSNIARRNIALCAPCGDALQHIVAEKGNITYTDNIHPTFTAQVSNAYVIYAALTGRSPVGLQTSFSVYNNTRIQEYAWKAYQDYRTAQLNICTSTMCTRFMNTDGSLTAVPNPTLPTSTTLPTTTALYCNYGTGLSNGSALLTRPDGKSDLLTVTQNEALSAHISDLCPKEWITCFSSNSTDDMTSVTVRSSCNHKGPTIAVMKSTTGTVFGAFTSASWTSSEQSLTSERTFIYKVDAQGTVSRVDGVSSMSNMFDYINRCFSVLGLYRQAFPGNCTLWKFFIEPGVYKTPPDDFDNNWLFGNNDNHVTLAEFDIYYSPAFFPTPTATTTATSTATTTATSVSTTSATSTATTTVTTFGFSIEFGTVQCTYGDTNTTRKVGNGKRYTKRTETEFQAMIANGKFEDIASTCSNGISKMDNLFSNTSIFSYDISGLDLKEVALSSIFTNNTRDSINLVYNLCLPVLTKNQSDHIFEVDNARKWVWERAINRSCDCLDNPCKNGHCFNLKVGSPDTYTCICPKNKTGKTCEDAKPAFAAQKRIFRFLNITLNDATLLELKNLFADEFRIHPDQILFETTDQPSRRRSVESNSLTITITDMDDAQTETVESFLQNPQLVTSGTILDSVGIEFVNSVITTTSSDLQPVNTTLFPTPKHNDTKKLSTTEIILIAVGGIVFSALAGFAIYKGVQKYKGAKGYTYVFQA